MSAAACALLLIFSKLLFRSLRHGNTGGTLQNPFSQKNGQTRNQNFKDEATY
jgi:hypothetical protein